MRACYSQWEVINVPLVVHHHHLLFSCGTVWKLLSERHSPSHLSFGNKSSIQIKLLRKVAIAAVGTRTGVRHDLYHKLTMGAWCTSTSSRAGASPPAGSSVSSRSGTDSPGVGAAAHEGAGQMRLRRRKQKVRSSGAQSDRFDESRGSAPAAGPRLAPALPAQSSTRTRALTRAPGGVVAFLWRAPSRDRATVVQQQVCIRLKPKAQCKHVITCVCRTFTNYNIDLVLVLWLCWWCELLLHHTLETCQGCTPKSQRYSIHSQMHLINRHLSSFPLK